MIFTDYKGGLNVYTVGALHYAAPFMDWYSVSKIQWIMNFVSVLSLPSDLFSLLLVYYSFHISESSVDTRFPQNQVEVFEQRFRSSRQDSNEWLLRVLTHGPGEFVGLDNIRPWDREVLNNKCLIYN